MTDAASGTSGGSRFSIPSDLAEAFSRAGKVETVFGSPVTHGDTTMVPVARARWGLGGGRKPGGGEGGGGGLRVDPLGYVVMKGGEAEFRSVRSGPDWKVLGAAFLIGLVLGRL